MQKSMTWAVCEDACTQPCGQGKALATSPGNFISAGNPGRLIEFRIVQASLCKHRKPRTCYDGDRDVSLVAILWNGQVAANQDMLLAHRCPALQLFSFDLRPAPSLCSGNSNLREAAQLAGKEVGACCLVPMTSSYALLRKPRWRQRWLRD
jgi:hypothetical protein